MWIILLCLFISVLFFKIFEFFRKRRTHNVTANIPGPSILPFIGSGYILFSAPEYFLNPVMEMMNFYGSPTKISVGPRVFIFVKSPEQIRTVLHSNVAVEKDTLYKYLKVPLGNGLLTSEHKIWRVHRKLLQPTFSTKILQSFTSIFQKNSVRLTQAVKAHIGCPEFELTPCILKAVFFNTFESVVGLSLETESENNIEVYLNHINGAMISLFETMTKSMLQVDLILPFIPMILKNHLMPLIKYTDLIIQKKRESMQRSLPRDNDKDNFLNKCKPPLEFMIELADNENKFSDKELRDHIMTIIAGSYDTSARALKFIFLMLASHPDIQDRVYDEIFDIYGDEDVENNPVKYEDLQKLNYLERVIKETLRLFPSIPLIARQATEDFHLDGYLIPKDCGIIVNIFALHRDEKIWPDPFKFDPDRFLPEAMEQRHPCDYIAFSYGSRNCIGRYYAIMSMKIILANFLREYILKKDKILPVRDIRVKMDILLQSVDPIKIRIEKRGKRINMETCTTHL